MVSNLEFFGIYEKAVDKAVKTCEKALTDYGLSNYIDSMHDEAKNYFYETGSLGNITNSLIDAFFSTVERIFETWREDAVVTHYVNGSDSHLYINGDEIR